MRDVGNLFNQSIDEDYYKTIKTINVFDNANNYIEHESKQDKNKNLSINPLNAKGAYIRPSMVISVTTNVFHEQRWVYIYALVF